jgi:hypothetical protein
VGICGVACLGRELDGEVLRYLSTNSEVRACESVVLQGRVLFVWKL